MRTIFRALLVIGIVIMGFGTAHALPSYLASFTTTYPATAASALNGCVLCHINPAGGGTRNAFGNDFASATVGNHTFNAALGAKDSDGDGFTNLQEINALTFPGDATSHPTTPPPSTACTGYTYSAWSACSASGQQTRTVTGNTPAGCTGTPSTPPVLTQACNSTTTDTTPPTVTAFGIPATSTSLTVSITSFSASDNVGVTGYLVNQSSTKPLATATGWKASAPASFTFGASGTKTLYAWAKDAAGNVSASKSATVTITSSTGQTGAQLYTTYCAGCHGPLSSSSKRGATATQIQSAINTVSAMSGLKTLTSSQIQAIASALATTTPPPATLTGAQLYAKYCATCHGTLASSSVKGASVSDIREAIGEVGKMAGLKTLTLTQIQKIAYALGGSTSGTHDARPATSQTGLIPVPAGQESFTYDPVASPQRSTDVSNAVPLGVGSVATGGNTVGLQVSVGRFAGPVDVYVTLYTPAREGGAAPESIYTLSPNGTFSPLSAGKAAPWKKGVTDVNQQIPNIPASELPAGTYVVILGVTPSGNQNSYYNWITSFVVQ